MALDITKNFSKVVVNTGYAAGITSIVLQSGDGARLPDPSVDGEFNLVWWNFTDYPDPSDDFSVEIVRVTARSTDTLTVTRAQEGTADVNHNTGGKTYQMILGPTKKTIDDIDSSLLWTASGSDIYFNDGNVGIGTASPLYSLDVDEIGNSAGDFHIQDNHEGNVVVFGGTDVGDGVDGAKFEVWRNAAAGDYDTYQQMYSDQYNLCHLNAYSYGGYWIDNQWGTMDLQPYSHGEITLFKNDVANLSLKQYGGISSSNKYIAWTISDTTDNFELTREDANIGAFDIQMPLITDLVTSSGGIIFPTSDPAVAGAWWDNAGTLTKSSG